ncbi:MAG: hypothetical protein ACI9MC_003452, partial [Kiritimatiellia bacterium]
MSVVFSSLYSLQWVAVASILVLGACSRASQPVPSVPSVPTETSIEDSSQAYHGLQYIERVTGGAEASDELPLIVAVHGLGDQPAHFAWIF